MPLIIVEVLEGEFTPAQKTQIAECLTDAMAGIEFEHARERTWCVVDEVRLGQWAVDGQGARTLADQAAIAA